jgi:hypothetical protein
MATITIPKKLIKEKELVVMPRKEYEAIFALIKRIKEFTPTAAQRRALKKAEDNFQKRKTMSYYELVRKLGFTN